jgi:coiled-coil domain-containing protein 130
MPYNIWCDGCKNHIGMGVRYNAEKTKLGMYYSTPLYQFRMKCHLCDNYIVIKTDPANLDYEIVSGARRQENRWDPTQNGQVVPDTKEIQRKLFDDPMFKLEHGAKDQKVAIDSKPVLGKMYLRNEDVWRDNYTANCKLRAAFRETKKEIRKAEALDNALLSKSSLDIQLLPECDQDKQMASLMKLQTKRTVDEAETAKRKAILNKPILGRISVTNEKRLKLISSPLSGLVRKKAVESNPSSTCSSDGANEINKSAVTSALTLLGNYSSSSETDSS